MTLIHQRWRDAAGRDGRPCAPPLPHALAEDGAVPAARGAPAISVREVDSLAGLDALRPEWDRLLATALRASVFMSWEWQRLWWQHYGEGQRLCVLVAWRDAEVVGIAPLYVQHRRLFKVLPWRLLRSLGTGGDTAPDDLDPLLAPGLEVAVAEALAHHLADLAARRPTGWDVAWLSDLASGSTWMRALEACAAERGWACRTRPCARITMIDLPASWPAYLDGLGKERRSALAYARRRFMALPQAVFRRGDGPAELDHSIDGLIALHHRRWQDRDEAHAFSSAAYVAFHRALMRALQPRDMLRLYLLEQGGELAAGLYCYRFRERVCYFQAGFDPALKKLSPGTVLVGLAIDSAMQEGCTVFDMLRGDHAYKRQWGQLQRQTLCVEWAPPGLVAGLYRLRHELLPRWKAGVRRRTEPPEPPERSEAAA
jgi:CelD/BcsL family acetyltransferase involved in cellulose biosynthesis